MGGSQYQIKCLLDELLPLEKFDIFYLARSVPASCDEFGYRLIRIGSQSEWRPLGFWHDAVSLYRLLESLSPDVIYQRVGCAYTGIAASYAQRHGARMVWHVAHDTDVTKAPLAVGRNLVRRFLEKRTLAYGVKHANRIVVQTKGQATLLRQNHCREADLMVRNFHPIASETLDKSGNLTVLWVANMKRWKRPEIFVRLAKSLSDVVGVRFVMVGAPPQGDGDARWFAELQRDIGDSRNVDYLGAQSQEQINALMAKSHIFVNTSSHEGFANTFIQAWMREVPVVSLDVNPDDILSDGKIGLLAQSELVLQTTVRTLLGDSDRRFRMGSEARAYALKEHSPRNVLSLIDLLDAEAARRPRSV